jgi:mono/diheme cytochrome c family protein
MRYTRQLAATAGLLASLTAGSVAAQEDAGDVAEGREDFAGYCAACHGQDATGNGPMAEIVAIRTPDLTGLSARNGGEFPMSAVAAQIDGRNPVLAHGGQMPLFGDYFDGDDVMLRLPSGQTMLTSRPIADLLAYLASIQDG